MSSATASLRRDKGQGRSCSLEPYRLEDVAPPSPSGSNRLGCDFVGIVDCLGEAADRIRVGDRVAGMTQGGNTLSPDDGAFAEYVVAKAHALIHLPKSLSPELGSTLPTALFTAGFCLYRHLSLAYPGEAEAIQSTQPVVFIYGGGTAIGSMQVQLAKLSGLRVISACSLESFDFVKQCGADVVVDYVSRGLATAQPRNAGPSQANQLFLIHSVTLPAQNLLSRPPKVDS
ncbi:hypothetical protein NW759_015368 [Fusarium solani]|nr:hypothetical protein NW759_015368 [Fusarium solani]